MQQQLQVVVFDSFEAVQKARDEVAARKLPVPDMLAMTHVTVGWVREWASHV